MSFLIRQPPFRNLCRLTVDSTRRVSYPLVSGHRLVSRRPLSVSLELLKDLRARSGAPIVECKKALQNTDNELDAAMDWLREHGAAKASSKVEGRETTEGLVSVAVAAGGKSASIVKVASETDFAGRSSKFVSLLLNVSGATLESTTTGPLSPEETLQAATADGQSVKDLLDEAIVAIRENLSVVDAVKLTSDDGVLIGYVHNKVDGAEAGTAAAIVELVCAPGKDLPTKEIQTIGKKLAMHAVAAQPQYLAPADVPDEDVAKERQIQLKQLESSGKPPEILEKIVEGKLRKFYEGICLTEQGHMIEEKNPKVSKVLSSHGLELRKFVLLMI